MTILSKLANDLTTQRFKISEEERKYQVLQDNLCTHLFRLIEDSLSVWSHIRPTLERKIKDYGQMNGFQFSTVEYDSSNLNEIVWQIGNNILPIFSDSCELISSYTYSKNDVASVSVIENASTVELHIQFHLQDGFEFTLSRELLNIYFQKPYASNIGNYNALLDYTQDYINRVEFPAFQNRCPDSPMNRQARLMEEAEKLGFKLVPKHLA